MLADRRRRSILTRPPRRRTRRRGMLHGVGSNRVARIRSARTACARGGLAATGDGIAHHFLSNLSGYRYGITQWILSIAANAPIVKGWKIIVPASETFQARWS